MAIVKWGFRRFYSSRQAVSEISELVAGSNVTSVTSRQAVSEKPIRGKVAIAARKKMLESFVDKYRAMNQGKFPSPSGARKEVGGGYYFLKKMLQEMEYNVQVSSAEKESVKEKKSKTKTKKRGITGSSFKREPYFRELMLERKYHELMMELKYYEECGRGWGFTEDESIGGYQVREVDLKDKSLLRDNFAFKDSESTAEKQHDEIQNITNEIPAHQKDEVES